MVLDPHPAPHRPRAQSPLRTGIYCGGLDSVCTVERVRVVCFRGGEVKAGCVWGRELMVCMYWVSGSEN